MYPASIWQANGRWISPVGSVPTLGDKQQCSKVNLHLVEIVTSDADRNRISWALRTMCVMNAHGMAVNELL